ncbi:hypothetical protein [Gordonia sp. (in: high G+C Gram-positive bacteria)]|uniref:hypothetical protein n=1 Tax=Gordonia sp. (in: high G+C Gram-positive bacteria) TaxID=84139 RepID=UPI00260B961A|nr:hypothetical protein [Gordonia sp. (in: high G+C Gram-positive bacteria)]HMS73828.1 hypothetical protein [Gordonia sp. (in: high G+C Gram-positive bacteria)]
MTTTEQRAAPSEIAGPVVTSPQPLGIFGFPAGLLLIPARTGDEDAVRAALVSGRLPGNWPAGLDEVRRAYADPVGEGLASEVVARQHDTRNPIDRYNRWALSPDLENAATVRAGLPEPWRPLVDAVCYIVGLVHIPPADHPGCPPELRALLLTAAASAQLESDPACAYRLLHQASALVTFDSPVLAAVVLGNAAGVLLDTGGDTETACAELESALVELADTDLPAVRAELHGRLGGVMHEQLSMAGAPLTEAMNHYLDGLSLVSQDSAPYVWASLQLDLATAYLASPMVEATSQLRIGIATQSLRAARRVFTPQDHPGPWSMATLNLANSLVYAPSTHRKENLLEAVDLYEEILRSGVRNSNPAARARVLANQGNALAHLGYLDAAHARLIEARSIFEEDFDGEAIRAVREVLDAIARSRVADPDQAGFDAEMARASAQYARMPGADTAGRTSGMGVHAAPTESPARVPAAPPRDAQRRAKVTVLPRDGSPA